MFSIRKEPQRGVESPTRSQGVPQEQPESLHDWNGLVLVAKEKRSYPDVLQKRVWRWGSNFGSVVGSGDPHPMIEARVHLVSWRGLPVTGLLVEGNIGKFYPMYVLYIAILLTQAS